MEKVCYLLMSKSEMQFSPKEVLERVKWPQWLKYHYIVCIPDSNMVALLLKVGTGVVLNLTVPDRTFFTSEMSYVLHGYCQAKSILPADLRDDKKKIWKDQMNVLLAPFQNG